MASWRDKKRRRNKRECTFYSNKFDRRANDAVITKTLFAILTNFSHFHFQFVFRINCVSNAHAEQISSLVFWFRLALHWLWWRGRGRTSAVLRIIGASSSSTAPAAPNVWNNQRRAQKVNVVHWAMHGWKISNKFREHTNAGGSYLCIHLIWYAPSTRRYSSQMTHSRDIK